jgi:hypothetical protein
VEFRVIRLASIALALAGLHACAVSADEIQTARSAANAQLMCIAPSDGASRLAGLASVAVNPPPARVDDGAAPAVAGMRVFLDPQTGRRVGPRPLPPQALAALERAMLRRDGAGLVQQILPNGAVLVRLQGRFHNMAVARIDPEGGRSTTRCVTSFETAQPLLAAQELRTAAPEASCGE